MKSVRWPQGEGVRVDTHIEAGTRVPPFYDSLLGKIIAHGRDRAQALARLRAARGDDTHRRRGHQSRIPCRCAGGRGVRERRRRHVYLARLLSRRVRTAVNHG